MITIKFDSTRSVSAMKRDLNRIKKDIGQFDELHLMQLTEVDKWIKKNFKQEGKLAHDGKKWQDHAPSTKKQIARTRRGGKHKKSVALSKSPKILQDKGYLRDHWDMKYDKKSGQISSRVQNKGVYYGIAHHEGAGHLPVRRIIPLQRQIKDDLMKIAKKFLKGTLKW